MFLQFHVRCKLICNEKFKNVDSFKLQDLKTGRETAVTAAAVPAYNTGVAKAI